MLSSEKIGPASHIRFDLFNFTTIPSFPFRCTSLVKSLGKLLNAIFLFGIIAVTKNSMIFGLMLNCLVLSKFIQQFCPQQKRKKNKNDEEIYYLLMSI